MNDTSDPFRSLCGLVFLVPREQNSRPNLFLMGFWVHFVHVCDAGTVSCLSSSWYLWMPPCLMCGWSCDEPHQSTSGLCLVSLRNYIYKHMWMCPIFVFDCKDIMLPVHQLSSDTSLCIYVRVSDGCRGILAHKCP